MKRRYPDNNNDYLNNSNKRQKVSDVNNINIVLEMVINRINNLEQNIIRKVNEIETRIEKIEKEIVVPKFNNEPSYFY